MTVKALIQKLLDCDMNAEVVFGTEEADFTVTGVEAVAGQVALDYEEQE